MLDKVLGWILEALGGQEQQKGNKMGHNGGVGARSGAGKEHGM